MHQPELKQKDTSTRSDNDPLRCLFLYSIKHFNSFEIPIADYLSIIIFLAKICINIDEITLQSNIKIDFFFMGTKDQRHLNIK